MMQLIKPRNVLQFKSCLNYVSPSLNQLNRIDRYQTSLARPVNVDDQINNEMIYNQMNNVKENYKSFNHLDKCISKSSLTNCKKVIQFPPKFNPDPSPNLNKPTREQLEVFHKYIEEKFPRIFLEQPNLAYFDELIAIEDNQSGITKIQYGLQNLVKKISFIRIYYSLMYSMNTMSVLSIAKIEDDGLVKLRWRIASKGRLLAFVQFWKLNFHKKVYFNDGIVYFYLNKNGKVKRLIIEKVEKDEAHSKITLDKVAKV